MYAENVCRNKINHVVRVHQPPQPITSDSPIIKPAVLNLPINSTTMSQEIIKDCQQKKDHTKKVLKETLKETLTKSQIPLKQTNLNKIKQDDQSTTPQRQPVIRDSILKPLY